VSLANSALGIIGHMAGVDPLNDVPMTAPLIERMQAARAAGGGYAGMLAVRNDAQIGRAGHGAWYGGYAAKDGGISVGCLTPATRRAMRRVLGIEGQDIDDPQFNAADPGAAAFLEDLNERLRAAMRSRTVREWLELFAEAGVPAAPVNFPELLADDEQAAAVMVELDHPTNGRQRQAGPFFTMSRTPPRVQGPSPRVGEHTEELLRSAGYSAAEVTKLRGEGVIA
jgi:crotonobetainyl-CoA:carnitine CoA-transferase CaiB-like acyl-CoA transferase